jgi:hypothetical protein
MRGADRGVGAFRLVGQQSPVGALCIVGRVSRWKLLDTWEKDLPGLPEEQLWERLQLAKEYESVR